MAIHWDMTPLVLVSLVLIYQNLPKRIIDRYDIVNYRTYLLTVVIHCKIINYIYLKKWNSL
jgi:hypothetical protein